MQRFRAFIKSRTDLQGNSLTNAGMQVVSFSITRDLLTSATSNIQLLQTPQAVREGDILGIYAENGRIIYCGVINSIAENIQCGQMTSLFNDEFININFLSTNTIEGDVKTLLYNATVGSNDSLLVKEFKPFVFELGTETQGKLMQGEQYSTPNFEERIYNIFDTYNVIVDFEVAFEPVAPKIKIHKEKSTPILLGNNAISVLSVIPTTTASEINKLVIYSQEKEENGIKTPPKHRATYYLTPNGVTENANDLSRVTQIKTRYVFSDDDLTTIKNGNLSNKLYSHEITCELALDGKLYDFWSWKLGQRFNIFVNGVYYETTLTGYTLNFQNNAMPSVILKFGKVRINLESKLFKIIKSQSV